MTKINDFLEKVHETNDFYKNTVRENNITNPIDITQYPILTRKKLQENRYNMFSDGYKSKYFSQQLRRQCSSGSSGTPINVYWDYKDYYSSTLSLWRKRMQYYGIHSYDRQIMFTLNAFNTRTDGTFILYKKEPDNVLIINISLIHKEDNYKKLIEIINEFEPVWFYIQPFVLGKLLLTYHKYKIKTPSTLKYIESVGELLSSDLKKKASDYFCVPIADLYGSEEMNGIAYECPYHNMHILDDNVLVECKNENGIHIYGEGEAIITNLNNIAMPLIRYNQGDQIVLSILPELCLCGCKAPLISLIKGRSLDSIKITNNIEINSFMLLEVISEVNNQFSDIIICYRYIYSKSENKLRCLIKLNEKNKKWYSNVKLSIESIFATKLFFNENIIFEVLPMEEKILYDKKFRVLEITE